MVTWYVTVALPVLGVLAILLLEWEVFQLIRRRRDGQDDDPASDPPDPGSDGETVPLISLR
jgi:hypothetical protein